MIGGSPQRFVVWDESADAPVIYDASSGSFEKSSVRPALTGKRSLKTKTGREIPCQPVFAALAVLAAAHNAARSQTITWVSREKVRHAAHLLAANRPVSLYMHNGVGQHTNATQTNRGIAVLYALLGDFDQPGGNVVFPKASVNAEERLSVASATAAASCCGSASHGVNPVVVTRQSTTAPRNATAVATRRRRGVVPGDSIPSRPSTARHVAAVVPARRLARLEPATAYRGS